LQIVSFSTPCMQDSFFKIVLKGNLYANSRSAGPFFYGTTYCLGRGKMAYTRVEKGKLGHMNELLF
jgi:hypothetical protein